MYKKHLKRILDILLSTVGIILLAFPMLIVAVIIKADSPGPVLFRQSRVGLNKKDFIMLKFRSMPVSAPKDVATHLLDIDSVHMTSFQKFIRKSSIDELPQLYNVWIGQLSLVGPRPCLFSQTDLIEERDKYGANDVKPGITGWAQINGRDELDISSKAKYDGEYVSALNKGALSGFMMDLKCFCGTFLSVLRSEGVVEGGTGSAKKANEKESDDLSV